MSTTLVTGLWDIGRGNLTEGWNRGFDYYLSKFEQLLTVSENLIIFGEKELEEFVWERRCITLWLCLKCFYLMMPEF